MSGQIAGEPLHQLASVRLYAIGKHEHVDEPIFVERVGQPSAGFEALHVLAEAHHSPFDLGVVELDSSDDLGVVVNPGAGDITSGRATCQIGHRIGLLDVIEAPLFLEEVGAAEY